MHKPEKRLDVGAVSISDNCRVPTARLDAEAYSMKFMGKLGLFTAMHMLVCCTAAPALAQLYADAEPFDRRALAINEKALAPYAPDFAKWLAIREKALGPEHPNVPTAFAQGSGLISCGKAKDDALNAVQRASQSAAVVVVKKLPAQLAGGSDRVPQLAPLICPRIGINSAK